MTSSTSGISLQAPLLYRDLAGVVADVWHVEVDRDGGGTYTAPDPRVVAVLGPGESRMRLGHATARHPPLPTVRVAYIPADLATWSSFSRPGRLSHLDVHFSKDVLARRIADAGLDPSALLHAPRMLAHEPAVQAVAERLAKEIRATASSRSSLDRLVSELITALFTSRRVGLGAGLEGPAFRGGLTPGQLARIDRLMREEMHRPVPVAEMAACADLSESWFAHAYCQSRGEPPHRALQRLRIDAAKALLLRSDQGLATIAAAVGFADQAHFTRVFRRATGESPGVWRRGRQFSGPA